MSIFSINPDEVMASLFKINQASDSALPEVGEVKPNGVHPNTEFAELASECSRERDCGALGRHVAGQVRPTAVPRNRTDVDDRSSAALHHVLRRGLCCHEVAALVHPDDVFVFLSRNGVEG